MPFPLVFSVLQDDSIDVRIRDSFAKLLLNLYVDVAYKPPLVNKIWVCHSYISFRSVLSSYAIPSETLDMD